MADEFLIRNRKREIENRSLSDTISRLAVLYRMGELEVEDIEPEFRDDISVWLFEHRKEK